MNILLYMWFSLRINYILSHKHGKHETYIDLDLDLPLQQAEKKVNHFQFHTNDPTVYFIVKKKNPKNFIRVDPLI